MIGELYENLPVEVVMNILKFAPHPVALMVKSQIEDWEVFICENHPYPEMFMEDCPFVRYFSMLKMR